MRIRRPLTLLRFLGVVLYDILIANFMVAYLILRGPRHLEPGFVVMPLPLRSDLAISLLANTISLTPGTVSAWLCPDRTPPGGSRPRCGGPPGLVETIRRRYEAPLREVFESC